MNRFLLAFVLLLFGTTPACFGTNEIPPPGMGKTFDRGWIESTPGFRFLVSPTAQYTPYNKDALQLLSGHMLLVGKHSGLVITPMGVTYIKQNAIIFFQINTGIERIMVLSSSGLHSVVAIAGHRAACLGPGDEVVITDHRPRIRETRQSDEVGRRSFRAFDVGNGLFMTTSEFSIGHLVLNEPLLHKKDDISESVRRETLKTASIIDMIMSSHGAYLVEPVDELMDYEPL